MGEWVVGVDLGGTKIDLGLVDAENRIVARRRIPTENEKGPADVVERIAQIVGEFEREISGRITAMGICTPGPVDHINGRLLTLVNVPGLSNTPLRQMLADRLKIPVRLEHDAKAAALGDFHYGAGRGAKSMIYIVIGTGVGAAIIIDGKLYYGDRNSSGESGHMTVNPNGDLCTCGTRGCLETYTSGPWLARRLERALSEAGRAVDHPITGELVAQLAENGDDLALKVVREAGEALGIAVASMAMVLNIDLNVVGGSVAKIGDPLFEAARKTVPNFCFKAVGEGVRVMPTALGDNGPILGCAWMAREALKTN
jgi:glucokinase